MMAKLGVTLLSVPAKVWFQNLGLLDSAPGEWLEFKAELRAYFKLENAMSGAREKMRNLRQTSSIAQYVQDFITLKLSIPRMTDEEAVDKFISGIKDHAARIHIKDNIFMENPFLGEAIRVAHIYEGNRQNSVPVSRGFSSSGGLQVDDPMDLSVTESREFYRSGFCGGGANGAHNGRGRGGQQQRGFNRGGGRAGVQCHNCEGFGHYMRDCPSPREPLNYAEAGDMDNDFDGVYDDNKDIDSSAYLYCVLPTSKLYIEPLLIDDAVIQNDLVFVLTAGDEFEI
ncbi:hypothetical protein PS6_011759 [Mucor atramentarius]